LVTDLQAKYGDKFNMILPFTPLVPNDTNASDAINGNLTVFSEQTDPVEVSLDSIKGLCMDSLNGNLSQQYLVPLFTRNAASLTNSTSAMWLNRNTPYLTGNNITALPDQFANLPYYPGSALPGNYSLPENAVHQA
jgi:hypothetical protein